MKTFGLIVGKMILKSTGYISIIEKVTNQAKTTLEDINQNHSSILT